MYRLWVNRTVRTVLALALMLNLLVPAGLMQTAQAQDAADAASGYAANLIYREGNVLVRRGAGGPQNNDESYNAMTKAIPADKVAALKNMTDATFVFRFKYSGSDVYSLLSLNGASGQYFNLYVYGAPTNKAGIDSAVAGAPKASISLPVSANRVHTLAFRYAAASPKYEVFLDGVKQAAAIPAANLLADPAQLPNLVSGNIGRTVRSNNQYYFNGDILDVQVYNTAIPDADLLSLTGATGGTHPDGAPALQHIALKTGSSEPAPGQPLHIEAKFDRHVQIAGNRTMALNIDGTLSRMDYEGQSADGTTLYFRSEPLPGSFLSVSSYFAQGAHVEIYGVNGTAWAVESDSQYTYVSRANNNAPTGITLEAEAPDPETGLPTVRQDSSYGTTVGALNSLDPDESDSHTYSLVPGEGDRDNNLFAISGNRLVTQGYIDGAASSYQVRIRTTDLMGDYMEHTFEIQAVKSAAGENGNRRPTDLTADLHVLTDTSPVLTTAATLATADPDEQDSFIYKLVPGPGDDDNGSFWVDGSELRTLGALSARTHTVRLRSTDRAGAFVEKALTLPVQAAGGGPVIDIRNVNIRTGHAPMPFNEADRNVLKNLQESTIVAQFRRSSAGSSIMSLIGVSNNTQANQHAHIYIDGGKVGYEIRADLNYSGSANFVAAADEINTVALKMESTGYKLFGNGKLLATIAPHAANGMKYIKDVPGLNDAHIGLTKRPAGSNGYPFNGDINSLKVYNRALSDEDLIALTAQTTHEPLPLPEGAYKSEPVQLFHAGDATGSGSFRIPALLTTKKGTVVAAIDARFGGASDSPNNLDTAVRIRPQGSTEWEPAQLPLVFSDYPNTGGYKGNSASYIDAVMVQDAGTERIMMVVDAFPWGGGIFGKHEAGSGYKTVNGQRYLMLMDKGKAGDNKANYTYSVREQGVVWDDLTNTPTAYTMNSKFELLKNSVPLTVTQKGTSATVPMNVFYEDADLQVFPTSYLMLTYSDDEGRTWSDPIDLNGMVKPENTTFLGTGPGTGIQLKQGEHAGRLVMPLYYHQQGVGGEFTTVMYSDDHGATWSMSESPNRTGSNAGSVSEANLVEMPDGQIKMFMRSTSGYVKLATSFDGGATWDPNVATIRDWPMPSNGVQFTSIVYSQPINGYPAVVLASPHGSSRINGTVRVGLVKEDGVESNGRTKWKLDWISSQLVKPGNYGYSSMTELPNGHIGLLYEGDQATEIPYIEMNMEYLLAPSTIERSKPRLTGMQLVNADAKSSDTLVVKASFDRRIELFGERVLKMSIGGTASDMTNVGQSADGSELYFAGPIAVPASGELAFELYFDVGPESGAVTEIYDIYGMQYAPASKEKYAFTLGGDSTEPKPADKTTLAAAIAEAQSLQASGYTSGSWSVMQTALAAAVEVNGNKRASQLEVDEAAQSLRAAITALVTESSGSDGEDDGDGNESNPSSGPQPSAKPDKPDNKPVKQSDGSAAVQTSGQLDAATAVSAASLDASVLDQALELAEATAGDGIKHIYVQVDATAGARGYAITLPAHYAAAAVHDANFVLKTAAAQVTIPSNLLESAQPEEQLAIVATSGDKPAIEISLVAEGRKLPWRHTNRIVAVKLPYQPASEEKRDPEYIVVLRHDDSGGATPVASGKYSASTGTIDFNTAYDGEYSVAYIQPTFTDLAPYDWAKKQVQVLASRGIVQGVSDVQFQPGDPLTRADYLVLLTRMLGLTAQADSNFADVRPDDYYYEALGIAKQLGIAEGTGGNAFHPQDPISRQDMMVLAVRALQAATGDGQPAPANGGDGSALNSFADREGVAPYAVEAIAAMVKEGFVQGSGDRLHPAAYATRAEAAVLIYRIYWKQ